MDLTLAPNIPVVWLSYHPETVKARGYWDQGWLERIFDQTVYAHPSPFSFSHHTSFGTVPHDSGAIVVIPARHHIADIPRINDAISHLPWTLIVLTGDEAAEFDWTQLIHHNFAIWVQTPDPNVHPPDLRGVGDWWRPETLDILRSFSDLPKTLDWFYAGQINSIPRRQCQAILSKLPGGQMHTTKIFGSGLPYPDYLQLLAQAKIAPCPTGPYCLTPKTPVLCADLVWRPVGELQLGQEIVGFDEEPKGLGQGGSTKYRTAKVTATGRKMLPCYRVETSEGVVEASEDHLWLVSLRHPDWKSSSARTWKRSKELEPDDRIVFFGPPWETDESWDAGWLAGILDGEGSLETETTYRFKISQNPGEVLEYARQVLLERGFKLYEHHSHRKVKKLTINGGRYETMRLIGSIRPKRFLARAKETWEGTRTSSRTGNSFAVVESVEPIGVRETVTLSTSTGTLIANGLLSHNTPDTFRLFEALEAGCIPVVERYAPNRLHRVPDYWKHLFSGPPPFPVIDDWTEFPDLLPRLLHDWPANANRIGAWWQQRKRYISRRLHTDIETFSGIVPPSRDIITVLIPTSPAPLHPDVSHLTATLDSIRAHLPTAEILLLIDGVRTQQLHRRPAYYEYTRRILHLIRTRYTNVTPVLFDEHQHQAAMTIHALNSYVGTPLVLFVEHDTPLTPPDLFGHIPFDTLAQPLLSGDLDLIRLHHEASILDPHQHLMIDHDTVTIGPVQCRRTAQWSQRPHIATANFYRGILSTYFSPESRTMIEDVMHGVSATEWNVNGQQGWEKFRLAVYHPDDSPSIKRSEHLDSRGDDPKYPMVFRYPNDAIPFGAPHPSTGAPA